MKQDEFIETTSRIETYFDKEYTGKQLKVMYEELKDFTIEQYRQLAKTTIRECKFLPKIADFLKANTEEQYIIRQDKEIIECKKCRSTGYITYTKIIKDGNKQLKYQYAAVCSCKNAKKYEGWKIRDKRYSSNYYTKMAAEIGL